MEGASRLGCLVLGAGRSERFGASAKLEAMLAGKRVGDHAPDLLGGIGFAHHVFVARPGGFRPADPRFRVVETVDPHAGQGHSLATGIAALDHLDCAGVLIALADMPSIEASHIAALLAAFAAHGGGVTSAMEGANGPPAILPLAPLRALETKDADHGARALLRGAFRVTALAECLIDIDSTEDLARAERILSARSSVQAD